MSSKTYDRLKLLAQVLLPALGTLYFTLAGIWGLPAAEQVVGTIVAVDTFLGVGLQVAKSRYSPPGGELVVTERGDKKTFSLELGDDPEILEQEKEVVFKVRKA